MSTLVNILSSTPLNPNVGYNNSWIEVQNTADRPLFAQAAYITNLQDLPITVNASSISIGSLKIEDGVSGVKASVVEIGNGQNALLVSTESIESKLFSIHNFSNTHTGFKVSDTLVPILAISVRPNVNATIHIKNYAVASNTNAIIGYSWVSNPTLGGGSFTWTNVGEKSRYSFLKDLTTTASTIAGGDYKHSGIVISRNNNDEGELSSYDLTGGSSPEIIVLCAQRLDSASAVDIWVSANIAEIQ